MDVNRDNFYDVLPQILEDINNADFVAIDGEFTGISAFDKLNYFDTPAERYQRHYEIDRKYRMVQLGLAMMRCTNPAENRFELKAYNFYIFPQDERDACDLISKTSSLQFLAANNFDFTQLFLKGIPIVCKSTHLKKLRESSRPPSESPNQRQMTNGNANDKKPSAATTNNNAVDYSQMTDDEVLRSTMTGFSEVIWKLQESGKPLVGHNLHMDLLHLIHEYFTPIPSSYEDYKTIVKNLFPKIIDTKTIASTTIFQNLITNTALNAVYRAVRESAFPLCHFQTPENFKYRLGEHEHTAGYDATCTAVCLAKMMAFIAEKTNFKENFMGHPLMNSFYGKIFYMRSFDLKYSDLLNNDELPDRSCVFYIKHPPSVSTYSLREFFHAWNLLTYDRLDPSTYIVALGMKNETTDTLLAKLRANAKDFTILSHAEYHRLSPTKIKVKEPNHLFDTDITNRKSNRRSNVDRDAPEAPKPVQMPMEIETSGATAPPPVKTIAKILEEKEKASGVKKRKLFDYDDEW